MDERGVALVTGGTRRIGRAIADRLASDGWRLALVYQHDERSAASTLAALRERGTRVSVIRADVSTESGAKRAVEECAELLGAPTLVVNNVGPFVPSSLVETTTDAYERMVSGNLGATFFVSRAVIPLMRERGGVIINLGSLNAELARGAPNAALYHALKAAVVVLTRSIARSEGANGIRANVVNPGMIDTLGAPADIVDSIPLGRLGQAEEVAAAVAWLASDEASYVSGTVINVSGGLWA